MLQPYLILGLDPNNVQLDDAMVRAAYLRCVKEAPPATHPARFTAVAKAYEQLKNVHQRLANGACLQPCDTELGLNALLGAAVHAQSRVNLGALVDALGRSHA